MELLGISFGLREWWKNLLRHCDSVDKEHLGTSDVGKVPGTQ